MNRSKLPQNTNTMHLIEEAPKNDTNDATAQELQDSVVELFENKNWPDFRESWFMKGESGPVVLTSVATTGLDKKGKRHELAGGMSPAWGQPYDTKFDLGSVGIQDFNLMPVGLNKLKDSDEGAQREKYLAIVDARKEASHDRVSSYLENIGGPQFENDVVIIKPQNDHYKDRAIRGNIVNADDVERTGHYIEDNRPAFMLYSHDPSRVVGIRPADCPTVAFAGHDQQGRPVHGLMHGGWQDEDAGFLEQGLAYLASDLHVSIKDLKFTIGPGGVNFDYKRPTDPRGGNDPTIVHEGWKTRTTDHEQVEGGVRFVFDMHGFAVDRLREAGATDEQIFIDSTDTASELSGHASHKLASQGKMAPMRDLVLVLSPDREKSDGR